MFDRLDGGGFTREMSGFHPEKSRRWCRESSENRVGCSTASLWASREPTRGHRGMHSSVEIRGTAGRWLRAIGVCVQGPWSRPPCEIEIQRESTGSHRRADPPMLNREIAPAVLPSVVEKSLAADAAGSTDRAAGSAVPRDRRGQRGRAGGP
jgi:hypothetical protein